MLSTLFSLRNPSRVLMVILLWVSMFLCVAFLYRFQILNGFSILSGDRFDGVINAVILEHWFNVFSGNSSWSEVNYFFPYTRTIAQTDGFFLIGVINFPFRLLGFDSFLSMEMTSMTIKGIGFLGAYLLCRKVFSFSFYWALLAAVLFTMNNAMTSHLYRIQFATVAFAPYMGLLLWSTLTAFVRGNILLFMRYGLVSGLFFGAWCLTCFYMAWFFAFFFFIFTLSILFINGRKGLLLIKDRFITHYGSVIFVIGSALVSLLPFIYAFLPKSFEITVRQYDEALSYTIPIEEILQVGRGNFLYGPLYNDFLSYFNPSYMPRGEYFNMGFSIALFILFLYGCMHTFKTYRKSSSDSILFSLVITTLVTWLMTLNIYGYSAWYIIYSLIPGAKALRVVSAYQVLLAMPVVIIALKYLSDLRVKLPVLLLISSFLIAGEINSLDLSLDRQVELARIKLPYSPPKECRVFYTSGWNEKTDNVIFNAYAHNVVAMMISQKIGLPTINGIASFNPPDFNFEYPNRSDYDDRVQAYSMKHGINRLCRLDLNTKKWESVDLSKITIPVIDFKKEVSPFVKIEGLSGQEEWGRWSVGDQVKISFTIALPKEFTMTLKANAFGPNVENDFKVTVGQETKSFRLTPPNNTISLDFNNTQNEKLIIIDIPNPISPKQLGVSADDRLLGIGLIELKINDNKLGQFD